MSFTPVIQDRDTFFIDLSKSPGTFATTGWNYGDSAVYVRSNEVASSESACIPFQYVFTPTSVGNHTYSLVLTGPEELDGEFTLYAVTCNVTSDRS